MVPSNSNEAMGLSGYEYSVKMIREAVTTRSACTGSLTLVNIVTVENTLTLYNQSAR